MSTIIDTCQQKKNLVFYPYNDNYCWTLAAQFLLFICFTFQILMSQPSCFLTVSTTCLGRHKTENNTSDSTDCWSQSASATGASSPDESMMQNNPKASEGKQGYLETAHAYKVVRPAASIKREVGFLKLVRT